MDIGHWTAPPGVKKTRKFSIWTPGRLDKEFEVPETQRQIDTHRDTDMDRGHWTTPSGAEKSRKFANWTPGHLDEDFDIPETQTHSQKDRHGQRTLDSALLLETFQNF